MAAAAPAVHGRAGHAEGAIARRADGILERLPEARPTRAAVELGRRREQVEIAARAAEHALTVLVVQRARERALRGFLAQHAELVRREELLPLVLSVRHLEGGLRSGAATARAEREASERAENRNRGTCVKEPASLRVH